MFLFFIIIHTWVIQYYCALYGQGIICVSISSLFRFENIFCCRINNSKASVVSPNKRRVQFLDFQRIILPLMDEWFYVNRNHPHSNFSERIVCKFKYEYYKICKFIKKIKEQCKSKFEQLPRIIIKLCYNNFEDAVGDNIKSYLWYNATTITIFDFF